MADAYGGASLTIAAEAAVDTASGIFDSTNGFRQQQSEKFNFSVKRCHPGYPRDNGRLYLRDFVDLRPSTLLSCLKKRAWALQENLMSRRLISFGKEQLYWRCITQESIEAYPSQALNFIKLQLSENYHTDFVCRSMNSGKTALSSWYGIVNDYTTRHISVRKDLLVGISAIAKVMAEEMGQPPTAYKAGLWENDFHEGLLWRRPDDSDRLFIRNAEYIALSWSWASISASHMSTRRIYQNTIADDQPRRTDAKIIEITIENENDDHFGKVSGGYVKLSGLTLEICYHKIPPIFWDCYEYTTEVSHRPSSYGPGLFWESEFVVNKCEAAHPQVLLVNIATESYYHKNTLILQRTENPDEYQRVGCLKLIAYRGKLQPPDWTTREITIV